MSEGEGERVMSSDARGVAGLGARRSGGGEGGVSRTRESSEERSVVTIAGMFEGDIRARRRDRLGERDYLLSTCPSVA